MEPGRRLVYTKKLPNVKTPSHTCVDDLPAYPISMAILGTDLLEGPTIYKAYFSGLCKGIYPQNIAKNMVRTYLHFRILEISH